MAERQAAGTQTVINYVVEARTPEHPRVTMWNAHEAEADLDFAREQYDVFRHGPSSAGNGGRLRYRLLRRTAVITDEILDTTEAPDE